MASTLTEPNTIPHLLALRAALEPNAAVYAVDGVETISVRSWYDRSASFASGLDQRGVLRGGRMVLAFGNRTMLEYMVAYVGTLMAGAIAVPLSAGISDKEVERFVLDCHADGLVSSEPRSNCGARWSCTQRAILSSTEACVPQPPVLPDHVAEVIYTSGSAGEPKGVCVTHANALAHFDLDLSPPTGIRPGPFLHALPIGTNACQTTVIRALLPYSPLVISMARFDSLRFCEIVEEFGVQSALLVPVMIHELVRSGCLDRYRLETLQTIVSTGAPASRDLLNRLRRTLPNLTIVDTYTSTEAWPASVETVLSPRIMGSDWVGVPNQWTEIRILADDETPQVLGAQGEIALRSRETPVRSYLSQPTVAGLTGAQDRAWVRTGDIGYLDADGHLHFISRRQDLLNVGGAKVAAAEVENAILLHPDIADVAVFPTPHPTLGDQVAAAVVSRRRLTSSDIRSHLRTQLASVKIPTHIVFVPELPRTATGKVKKGLLGDLTRPLNGPTDMTADVTTVQATLARLMATVLDLPEVSPFDSFFDLGGDSLAALRLAATIREQLQVDCPVDAVFEQTTPVQLGWFLATRAPNEVGTAAFEPGRSGSIGKSGH